MGITLSNLREAGAPIKGYEGCASGDVPYEAFIEQLLSYQPIGATSQGAGVVYLNVFHPDIIAFLSTKKENANEKVREDSITWCCKVPYILRIGSRKNEEMYLFSPYSRKRIRCAIQLHRNITKKR